MLARSGYRRRCSECRAALRDFRRAIDALRRLEAEGTDPDRAPAFRSFSPWLYWIERGAFACLEFDPHGRILKASLWS